MISKTLRIGGANRPILFGHIAFYLYTRDTGRDLLTDFESAIGPYINGGTVEMPKSGSDAPAVFPFLVDLTYYGLRAGEYAATKREIVDFTPTDVALWYTEANAKNEWLLDDLFAAWAEAMPKSGPHVEGEVQPAAKKAPPPTGKTTGKRR